MKVRIYKPAKSTMQSGFARTKYWLLESVPPTPRRPEPLMGWTASDDTLNQVKLRFPTEEQAITHAQQQGWEMTVDAEHERVVRPRNYADNFRYIPPKDDATK